MMKAIVFERYGKPEDVLVLAEKPRPVPKENEVLVRIMATAINDYDWSLVRGIPRIYRLMYGLAKPKFNIPGMELAGVIEEVGRGVRTFKPGDQVYGDISSSGFGTFADYVCVDAGGLRKKPEGMTFEQAASIPHASLLALQGLRDRGKMAAGQKILINGAGGGVGTIGLQLAKSAGCEVTGVDTGDKLDMMRSIGFDQVIDYKTEDFTKSGRRYDLILDCKSSRAPFSYLRALAPQGRYVTVGGKVITLISILFWGKVLSLFSSKKLLVLALKPNEGLEHIGTLYSHGKLQCVVDGPYALEELPERLQYFGDGKHSGKVVIKVPK